MEALPDVMPTPHATTPASRSSAARARRPAAQLLLRAGIHIASVVGSILPQRHMSGATASGPAAPRLDVFVIDDPETAFRLVGAHGPLDGRTVLDLLDALDDLGRGALHLDLTDVTIVDAPALGRVEAMLDELEHQGVSVRIVGIDPTHPSLAQHTHSP